MRYDPLPSGYNQEQSWRHARHQHFIKSLKDLKRLAQLHLDRTQVTDDGLSHLQALSGLWLLSLDGTAATDASLRHLTQLKKSLESLNLRRARK